MDEEILEELMEEDEGIIESNGILGSSIPVAEQETVIQFSRAEKKMTVNTSDSTIKTKLNHLCKDAPDNWTCTEEGPFSTYVCRDKSLLTLRRNKIERSLTDEQREAMAERMRKFVTERREKQL